MSLRLPRPNPHSRPGVLKVFWPAVLGWGAFGVAAVAEHLGWSGGWGPRLVAWAVGVAIVVAPLGAILVALRFREGRALLPIVFNLSTLIFPGYLVKLAVGW